MNSSAASTSERPLEAPSVISISGDSTDNWNDTDSPAVIVIWTSIFGMLTDYSNRIGFFD